MFSNEHHIETYTERDEEEALPQWQRRYFGALIREFTLQGIQHMLVGVVYWLLIIGTGIQVSYECCSVVCQPP